jgi:hypothetical protein
MSDTFLRLVPIDPEYRVGREELRKASAILASFLPQAKEVTFEIMEKVSFIDPGQNLDRILCPTCGHEVDMGWWGNAMDAAYQTGFADLLVKMPCCGATISLNDLHYNWPAGFGRFVLEARNPRERLKEQQLKWLEAVLGCELREILAHY